MNTIDHIDQHFATRHSDALDDYLLHESDGLGRSAAWRSQQIQHLLDARHIGRLEDLPYLDHDGHITDVDALDAWLERHDKVPI